jgi:hypothetical protein
MTNLGRIFAAILVAIVPLCSAQTKSHNKTTDAKPEPTQQEIAEYVRGSLLSLSPNDGINDNQEVTFDFTNHVLSVAGPLGRCDFFLDALNPNNIIWDVYDPSDTDRQREKLLRLTLVSVSGKAARTCYDKQNRVNADLLPNRARFLFSLPKTDEVPDFQEKIAKAFKKLIELSGGQPAGDIF